MYVVCMFVYCWFQYCSENVVYCLAGCHLILLYIVSIRTDEVERKEEKCRHYNIQYVITYMKLQKQFKL